jgi:hypothetical protein
MVLLSGNRMGSRPLLGIPRNDRQLSNDSPTESRDTRKVNERPVTASRVAA